MEREQIVQYLTSFDLKGLLALADEERRAHCGQDVFLRGIVEFSSYCCRRCLYCGLRRDNARLPRYRMSVDEIFAVADDIIGQGLGTVVLQSGDDAFYSREMICEIIQRIKARAPDTAVTLSLGERPLDDYRVFRDSGADRYLLKHETINRDLYEKLHPGQSLSHRLTILRHLRDLGYQVGTGCIVGLPGQTVDDLADELVFIQQFGPDMIGIGPLLPQADTPLKDSRPPPLDLLIRFLALTRIVSSNALIPASTAVMSLDPDRGLPLALAAGCNVVMINFTPAAYRQDYRIYDGKVHQQLSEIAAAVIASGRKVGLARGDCSKPRRRGTSFPGEHIAAIPVYADSNY